MLFAKRDDASPATPTPEEPLRPYRQPNEPSLALVTLPTVDTPPEPIVRPIAWAAVLAQLIVVFGVFALVNASSLFGGHAFVRARGPMTYARYLHAGFTQLSIAALLAVVTVLIGHVVLRRRGESSSAPVPGGAAIATLEGTLLGLVAIALASCAQRLSIYQDAYGFTYERLFVGFFQIGVLGMLVLTFVKAVARGFRHYAASAVVFFTGLCVCMSWFDADRVIAQRQLARAAAGHSIDWNYLSSLSEDSLAGIDLRSAGAYRPLVEQSWLAQRELHLYDGWRSVRGVRNAF